MNKGNIGAQNFRAAAMAVMCVVGATIAHAAEPPLLRLADDKITFDVEERMRLESRNNNFDFNDNRNPLGDVTDDAFLLQRFRFGLTARPLEGIVARVQVQDSRQIGTKRPDVPFVFGSEGDDPLDLYQAYLELGSIQRFPVTLKIGRQELSYGNERLVGSAGWNNFARTFDSVKLHSEWLEGGLRIDAFAGHVVNITGFGPGENDGLYFNESDRDDTFCGLNLTWATKKIQTDFFLLFRNKESRGPVYTAVAGPLTGRASPYDITQKVWTPGIHVKSVPDPAGGLDFDIEAAYQFGQAAGQQGNAYPGPEMLDQRAFAAHAALGYTWARTPWKPRLGVEYNLVSGDSDPNDGSSQSFLNQFPSNHSPYGRMDLFSWKNLHDLACGLRLTPFQDEGNPKHKLSVDIEFHAFWLYSNEDAWYRVNGVTRTRPLDSAALNADRFAGTELDLTLSYMTPWNWLRLDAGYSRFFAGSYLKDTANTVTGAGSDDADLAFLQATVTF